MPSRFSTQVSVAKRKQEHPEQYCPVKNCLWHTGGGYCPRHQHLDVVRLDINTELKRLGWSMEDAIALAVMDGVIPGGYTFDQLTPEYRQIFLEHLQGAEPSEKD